MAVRQNQGEIALAACGGATPLPKLGGANPAGPHPPATEARAPQARVSAAAPAVPMAAHARKLGLSSSDVRRYEALWAEAETTQGFLPAGQAVQFLGTSGLPQADLGKIWGLADYRPPKRALAKDEFYVACKLVALRQAGGAISFGGIGAAAPLPKLGANTSHGAEAEDLATPTAAPTAALAAFAAGVGAGMQGKHGDLPGIAKKLSLSQSDYDAYAAFWAGVDKADGFFPAGQAVRFLGSSGLPQADLVHAMSRSIPPPWGSIRFRLALRTYAPWGVRVVSQTKSLKNTHPENITALFREQGKIWSLSDFKAPKGKLSMDEFFVACKLVALRQAGKEASMGALAGATALPTFN